MWEMCVKVCFRKEMDCEESLGIKYLILTIQFSEPDKNQTKHAFKVDTNLFEYVILVTLGAVAQLGERLNGIQKVVGSIPISSTKHFQAFALP